MGKSTEPQKNALIRNRGDAYHIVAATVSQEQKSTDQPSMVLVTDDGITVRYKDKVYKVFARIPDEDEAKELTLLFFKNITDITALETEKKLSQPVVILFMVDGYEELISGCLESEKAHVSVQIDKLLEDFAGQTTGVLRKNASDRFIAVIEERHLQEILFLSV